MFENSEEIESEVIAEDDNAPTLHHENKDTNNTERVPSTGSNGEELSDSEAGERDPGEAEDGEEKTPSKGQKLFRFPQGRIKQIMKLDPDVNMVNGEAIYLVNKAVEEFIQCLAVESYHHTASSKKKTISKEHVLTAIESNDELAFLDGAMED